MKYLIISSFLMIFFTNNQNLFSQVTAKEVKAKIDISNLEDAVAVSGTVENLKAEYKNISFTLLVIKTNKSDSNKSNNQQNGRLTLEPLQKVSLSTTQINFDKKDKVAISLFIYDEDNKVIGVDKIIMGDDKITDNSAIKKPLNDGLEMKVIVSNDTKTKLGNDFYTSFYKEFSKLKSNSTKIICIQEELTFGRTTKISIDVEGEIIDEFIARPDEDYIESMAVSSSSKVYKYFTKLEKQDKSIFQY